MQSKLWLGLLCLPTVGSFSTGAVLAPRSASAAAFASVPFAAPLQVPLRPAIEDVGARLRSVAVAWAGSLAGSALPADDLMLALVSPEAFWLLRVWRTKTFGHQEAMQQNLEAARREIRRMAHHAGSPLKGATVSVRSKGLWSTFHKATVRQKEVHDVLAVRVVLRGDDAEADAYGALAYLRAHWPAVPGRFKDYVAFPKENGYAGLHDTLTLPCGRAFEVQIRTESMHREAEWGEASHRKYKGAAVQLSERIAAGLADGRAMRWPLQPQTALALATKVADERA